MSRAVLTKLCPALALLAQKEGWEIIKEERSGSFDNALVQLESSDFVAQVVRDRGNVSIDLSPLGKHRWTDLETVLEFIGEKVPSRNVETLSMLLEKNCSKIGALMTSDTNQLEDFEKKRSSEFINRIFPSS